MSRYEDSEKSYLRAVKYYNEKVAAGQCVSCGKEKEADRQQYRLCKVCNDKRRLSQRARYAKWVNEGKCTACGGETEDSHKLCKMCRMKARFNMQKIRERRRGGA